MKKLLLMIMLVISMTGTSFAQGEWAYYAGKSKTEQLFDIGRGPFLRHHFVIRLKNSNSISIQVGDKEAFERLLNLDSIIRAVTTNLALFRDSLQNEVIQKRIDYINDSNLVKIRIRQYQPAGASFVLEKDGPAVLKIEQDTLNITSYRSKPAPNRPNATGVFINVPYKITILINDINKLETIADGTLNKVMEDLNKQWDDLHNWSSKNNNRSNLYAYYNTTDPKQSTPMKILTRRSKWTFSPYVQMGVQNVNNLLTTSVGAGFQLTNRIVGTSNRYRYQVFWEPYFFFDREPDNKFRMQRNDFVTAQFVTNQTSNLPNGNKFEFNQSVSLGYLVHRSGNYFSDNTFKVGLPGASFKFITLHPELIFHDLFKDFQPGLKLFLDLD